MYGVGRSVDGFAQLFRDLTSSVKRVQGALLCGRAERAHLMANLLRDFSSEIDQLPRECLQPLDKAVDAARGRRLDLAGVGIGSSDPLKCLAEESALRCIVGEAIKTVTHHLHFGARCLRSGMGS